MEKKHESILRFHGEYEFLNNFYPAKLRFDGQIYYNSEAAYQAHKSEREEDRRQFTTLDPDTAKKLGNRLPVRPDWEEVKIPIMERIIYEKFTQNPELGRRLIATGDAYLAEGNYWHDVYWGVDHETGEGENHLGKLLMALRERLKTEGIPERDDAPGYRTESITGITLTDQDITRIPCDAIVCAATQNSLLPGSGLDGAIHRESGEQLTAACREIGFCQTGEAHITPGFHLPARHVLHTVGPVWGSEQAEETLEDCYRNCLELARENDLHSIVFPLISTGKFRFPKTEAARIAVHAVRMWQAEHVDYPMEITFSCVVHALFECLSAALTESEEEALIPEGATRIPAECFFGNTRIKRVKLPDSVATIGERAFAGCKALSEVTLPDGLKRLCEDCFSGCESLNKIALPETLASLRSGAFRDCTALAQMHLPDSLRRNIESNTFSGCTSLKSVHIPAGVHTVKSGAFSGCISLEQVEFGSDGVRIAEGAFRGCDKLSADLLAYIQAHTPDRQALDIRSTGSGLSGRLSNYTQRHFVLDGVECASIEGALQSFKCPDEERRREICRLWDGNAKNAGAQWEWQENQTLYWNRASYAREGAAYQRLLDRLYDAVYAQDESFRRDVAEAAKRSLDHSMGLADPKKTVLTREEFLHQIYRLGQKEAAENGGE